MNLKLNRINEKGFPSCFMEIGLSEKDGVRPKDQFLEVTKTIKEDRNPIWNTQFLLNYLEDEE